MQVQETSNRVKEQRGDQGIIDDDPDAFSSKQSWPGED